jgi:hypothetical protein
MLLEKSYYGEDASRKLSDSHIGLSEINESLKEYRDQDRLKLADRL